ncbi:microtubule associated-domain-containing protein, partial [Umbelopsis sp. AD052]
MDVSHRPHALEVGSLPNDDLFSPVTPTAGPRFPPQSKERERNFEDEEDDEYDNGGQDFVIPTERNEDANDTLTHELDLLSIDDADESLLSRQSGPSREKDSKVTLTLKEQEKTIDELRKESFGLKLKCYFLEERLAQLSPGQMDEALRENIDLKVKMQTLVQELKKYKKMI